MKTICMCLRMASLPRALNCGTGKSSEAENCTDK